MVNAAFDDDLLKIKAEMDSLKEDIEAAASKMASSLGLDKKSLKLDWSTQHGYCFRVTMKDEQALRYFSFSLNESEFFCKILSFIF